MEIAIFVISVLCFIVAIPPAIDSCYSIYERKKQKLAAKNPPPDNKAAETTTIKKNRLIETLKKLSPYCAITFIVLGLIIIFLANHKIKTLQLQIDNVRPSATDVAATSSIRNLPLTFVTNVINYPYESPLLYINNTFQDLTSGGVKIQVSQIADNFALTLLNVTTPKQGTVPCQVSQGTSFFTNSTQTRTFVFSISQVDIYEKALRIRIEDYKP